MSSGKRYLVDDNGVVLSEIEPDEWLQVKTHKNFYQWKQGVSIKIRFLKMFPDAMKKIGKEYPMFFDLVNHITYLENSLVFENGVAMNNKNIAKMNGKHIRTVQKEMKRMCDDDVLRKMKLFGRIVYVVNPWICMKGNKILPQVYDEFASSDWRTLSERRDKENGEETDDRA